MAVARAARSHGRYLARTDGGSCASSASLKASIVASPKPRAGAAPSGSIVCDQTRNTLVVRLADSSCLVEYKARLPVLMPLLRPRTCIQARHAHAHTTLERCGAMTRLEQKHARE